MSLIEEYLFWRTAHFLIVGKGYRVIQISRDQGEIWLERTENREAEVVRLLCYNLDWSNWLQKDIEMVAVNGERMRKKFVRGKLSIINLYFTAYPPVDDYEHLLTDPLTRPGNGKIQVKTIVLDRTSQTEALKRLESIWGEPFNLPDESGNPEIEIEQLKSQALSKASERSKAENEMFKSGKPLFTYFLIAAQILLFLLMELKGGSTNTSTLIKFGAKFNPLILEGEWWRFFSPVLLHIGALHLFMNSLALYYLGPMVERIYGNFRFLFIYILAGFAGSLASFLFSPSLSAGASGAIFGCFGALLYFGSVFPRLFFRSMGMNILIVLAINLLFGFSVPGIDNAGHIGGLLGGFAAAGIVHLPKKRKFALQALIIIVTFSSIFGLLQYGYSDSAAVVDEKSVLLLAQEYIQTEEYNKAFNLLDDFEKKEQSESADILFLLSYTEIKRGNLGNAAEHLETVLELKPNFHEAHYNLALVYLEQKNFRQALIHSENALKISPEKSDYQSLNKKISSYLQSAEQE